MELEEINNSTQLTRQVIISYGKKIYEETETSPEIKEFFEEIDRRFPKAERERLMTLAENCYNNLKEASELRQKNDIKERKLNEDYQELIHLLDKRNINNSQEISLIINNLEMINSNEIGNISNALEDLVSFTSNSKFSQAEKDKVNKDVTNFLDGDTNVIIEI